MYFFKFCHKIIDFSAKISSNKENLLSVENDAKYNDLLSRNDQLSSDLELRRQATADVSDFLTNSFNFRAKITISSGLGSSRRETNLSGSNYSNMLESNENHASQWHAMYENELQGLQAEVFQQEQQFSIVRRVNVCE